MERDSKKERERWREKRKEKEEVVDSERKVEKHI